jgi:hypothetical protein
VEAPAVTLAHLARRTKGRNVTLKTTVDDEGEWLTNASETNRLQASIAELTARLKQLEAELAKERSDG